MEKLGPHYGVGEDVLDPVEEAADDLFDEDEEDDELERQDSGIAGSPASTPEPVPPELSEDVQSHDQEAARTHHLNADNELAVDQQRSSIPGRSNLNNRHQDDMERPRETGGDDTSLPDRLGRSGRTVVGMFDRSRRSAADRLNRSRRTDEDWLHRSRRTDSDQFDLPRVADADNPSSMDRQTEVNTAINQDVVEAITGRDEVSAVGR